MRLVLDVETNGIGGFRPPSQRVMQLAYGAWDGGEPPRVVSVLIRGAGAVSPAASALHGISLETCERDGVCLGEAVATMCDALEKCDEIVGHNLDFDTGTILNQLAADGRLVERDRFRGLLRDLRHRCTMKEGTPLCRLPLPWRGGGHKFPSLCELHTHLFGAPPECRLHDAAADCEVTAKCLDAMDAAGRSEPAESRAGRGATPRRAATTRAG